MNKEMKKFLVASCAWAAAAGAALLSQGCSDQDKDPDPGVCYTTNEFRKSEVTRSYVESVCQDWVRMLISNCVSIQGLEPNATGYDIAAYCGRNVVENEKPASDPYPGYGDEEQYSYQLRHACNFIDNPNYECRRYGSENVSLAAAALDLELRYKLAEQIKASPMLQATASSAILHVEGNEIDLGTQALRKPRPAESAAQ